jgi:hypothetical protein
MSNDEYDTDSDTAIHKNLGDDDSNGDKNDDTLPDLTIDETGKDDENVVSSELINESSEFVNNTQISNPLQTLFVDLDPDSVTEMKVASTVPPILIDTEYVDINDGDIANLIADCTMQSIADIEQPVIDMDF